MKRATLVLAICLTAAPAAAQPEWDLLEMALAYQEPIAGLQGPGAQGPPGSGLAQPPVDMTPAEVQKIFDGYLVIQAQDALRLTDQQFAQFVTRVRVLQETRRRNTQERIRLINELQRLTRPALRGDGSPDPEKIESPVADAVLKERLSALQELESRAAAELRKAYNGVDEILSVVQQARFRVFEENIERRKLELLGRARQGPPNRPNQQQPRRPPGTTPEK